MGEDDEKEREKKHGKREYSGREGKESTKERREGKTEAVRSKIKWEDGKGGSIGGENEELRISSVL